MIVRTLQAAEQTDRRVVGPTWESTRLLLHADGMGFSFHITTIHPGTETAMEYRNHLEAVYCLEGEGELECLADGQVYPIAPGTIYALDQHDKHILRAKTQIKFACVFHPALHGQEVHDSNGSYPLLGDD